MNKKELPIGTVVMLVGGSKKVMITGYRSKNADADKVFDYNGCVFPEGLMENIYCRHCFILADEMVIDPTLINNSLLNDQDKIYYTFKIFETAKEYIDALEKENGLPALYTLLRFEDGDMQKWGKENGIFCVG